MLANYTGTDGFGRNIFTRPFYYDYYGLPQAYPRAEFDQRFDLGWPSRFDVLENGAAKPRNPLHLEVGMDSASNTCCTKTNVFSQAIESVR